MKKLSQNKTRELIGQYLRYTSLLFKIKKFLKDADETKSRIHQMEDDTECGKRFILSGVGDGNKI